MVVTWVVEAVAIDDITPPCRAIPVISLFTDVAIWLLVLPVMCVSEEMLRNLGNEELVSVLARSEKQSHLD